MPPRLTLRPLARQCQSLVFQQRAAISSTPKNESLKFTDSSASKALMDMDDGSRNSNGASPAANNASQSPSPDNPPMDALYNMMEYSRSNDRLQATRQTVAERAKEQAAREDLARQMTRNWKPGDVYAPHDLSPVEMLKWRQPKQPTKDIIDMLGLNPLDHYRNFSIMSEFMTSMGRIKHSRETGLRPVNQRKMAKAIRRSIGMGIHPSTHMHPMIIFREAQSAPRYQNTRIPEPDRPKIKPM